MRVFHFTEVTPEPVQEPDATGVSIRWAISRKDGAPTFAMRVFDVEPGGHTPCHEHWNEQEMFILEGQGRLTGGTETKNLSPGTVIYVAPYEPHGIENTGPGVLRFICCIPLAEPSQTPQ